MAGAVKLSVNPFQSLPAPAAAPAARLQVLTDASSPMVDSRVIGRKGQTLFIETSHCLQQGEPVRLHVAGGTVVGNVQSSVAWGNDQMVSINIEQVIPVVSDLARLVQGVMKECTPTPVIRVAKAAAGEATAMQLH